MQMLLACGAFVISEKITPNAYLRPGIDYVEVASPADAQAAVEYYLHNEEERITVATNGCRRVNDLLNGRLVFKELIEKISNSEIEKYRSTEPSRSWEFIGVCSNFWHGLRARIQK